MNDIRISKDFKLKEFECKDGSHLVKVDEELIQKLQLLRDKVGLPIHITSGYRSQEYNSKVGGHEHSFHMEGKAADIQVQGVAPGAIAIMAEAVGFRGIGTYKSWVHVDVGPKKLRWKG